MRKWGFVLYGTSTWAMGQTSPAPPVSPATSFVIWSWLLLLVLGVVIVGWCRRTPTLQQYLATNPSAHTGSGIKCATCGSRSIFLSYLLRGHIGPKRHICRGCGQTLYRS